MRIIHPNELVTDPHNKAIKWGYDGQLFQTRTSEYKLGSVLTAWYCIPPEYNEWRKLPNGCRIWAVTPQRIDLWTKLVFRSRIDFESGTIDLAPMLNQMKPTITLVKREL